jgi:hypothetical protein
MFSRLCAQLEDPSALASCAALDRGETLSNEQTKQLLALALQTATRTEPRFGPTRAKAALGQRQIARAVQRTRPLVGQIGERRPLALAREILLLAQELGFAGVLAYTLGHEPIPALRTLFDPEEEEGEVRLQGALTICLNVAAYHGWMLNSQDGAPLLLTLEPKGDALVLDLSTLLGLGGLYAVDFEGSESHAFTWIIDGDTLTYAGGYGGVCQMVVADFDRLEYLAAFVRAMQGSLDDYVYVFQLPSPPAFEVGFISLRLWPSLNYK